MEVNVVLFELLQLWLRVLGRSEHPGSDGMGRNVPAELQVPKSESP